MTKTKETSPLGEHSKDYLKDIWEEYSQEEMMWWVTLLVRRSTHRSNNKKSLKDIHDAKNYLWMLEQTYKEE